MISEFVEVILKIFEGINKNKSPENVIDLINKENLYNKKVLAAAYSWIYDKILRDALIRKSSAKSTGGMRLLSEFESQLIGLDNYGYVLHFYNVGIINNEEMEFILSQLLLFPEGTINKEKIDALIFSLFLDIDNYVLPGSRLILFSSDKIN